MGYRTRFVGRVEVSPPLNAAEVAYLTAFNESRRWDRPGGPYDTSDAQEWANRARANNPPEDQPHVYCPFRPTPDGTAIVWDQGEGSVYGAVNWMIYLIHHFLRKEAIVSRPEELLESGVYVPPEFAHFTCDHTLNGGFHAQGDEVGDVWTLLVRNDVVTSVEGHVPLETSKDGTQAPSQSATQKEALAPARRAMNNPQDDYTGMDPQIILDTVLAKLIAAGYTVIAPDGKTQVESPS